MTELAYVCPVCGRVMKREERRYVCPQGHSFDIARKGYVNLLTTSGHNPATAGDDTVMVRARTEFLDSGHYGRLAERVGEIILAHRLSSVIDSGCGEGYYTCVYARHCPETSFYGIDISKAAVNHCMTRVHTGNTGNCSFAVASSFGLPFEDHSADGIVSTFAPVDDREYSRVLKNGGVLIVVSPSPRHLYELKEAVYDRPYENRPNSYGLSDFDEESSEILEYETELDSQKLIFDLFSMTPYFYKTSARDTEKLRGLERLRVTCGFCIQVYRNRI